MRVPDREYVVEKHGRLEGLVCPVCYAASTLMERQPAWRRGDDDELVPYALWVCPCGARLEDGDLLALTAKE